MNTSYVNEFHEYSLYHFIVHVQVHHMFYDQTSGLGLLHCGTGCQRPYPYLLWGYGFDWGYHGLEPAPARCAPMQGLPTGTVLEMLISNI
jgi:hypothetical protein